MYSVPIKDNKSEIIGRIIIFNPQLHSGDLEAYESFVFVYWK